MKDLNQVLESVPKLYSTENQKVKEVKITFIVLGTEWQWNVVEAEKQDDGDWLFFCYCRSGLGEDVFPFLKDGMTTLEEKNTIFSVNNKVSTQLKNFVKHNNIQKNPSPTYARHSFATNMRRMGVPAEYIEYAMGHALKGVAGNYFGGYPFETMVKYNSMLLRSHDLQLEATA